jgi:tripartite-type tricarboxylate transporter receptor subunit TctC
MRKKPIREATMRVDAARGDWVSRILRRAFALALSGALAAPWFASAQATEAYPGKPIRLIVPFAPGGGTDILARALAPRLGAALGGTVVVENRPGAGGNLGVEMAARSAPDGYTLVMVSASFAVNASYQSLRFDPIRDLAPVAQIATVPLVLLARSALPVQDLRALIALARQRPESLTYASSGIGSSPHLAGELFVSATGTRMTHVPYKGGAPALSDLLGGQVDLLFSTVVQGLPHIQAGKVKPLAVASLARSKSLPDVPTIDESGFSGFDVTNWFGVLAPAGLPAGLLASLNAHIRAQLDAPELRTRLESEGAEPRSSSAEEFARLIASDIRKYTQAVKAAGISAQ